jgi:osmotically-inducible protein OsmY
MNTRMKTFLMAGALIAAATTVNAQAVDQSDSSQAIASGQPATQDQLITTAVQEKLRNDPSLSGEIGVETNDGDVSLNGLVVTPGEADRAELDALSIDGVKNVENYLKVQVGGDF